MGDPVYRFELLKEAASLRAQFSLILGRCLDCGLRQA